MSHTILSGSQGWLGKIDNLSVFTDTIMTKKYSQDTKTIVVSATCGGGMIKMSSAGSTNTTSGKFYIMEDGRIMGGRGHVHGRFYLTSLDVQTPTNASPDGGVAVHMYINDKYTCSSNAEYGYRGEGSTMGGKMSGHSHGDAKSAVATDPPKEQGILTVASMTDCEGPFKVKKGDYVVLKAEYDLKKHPL
jgi:hypothetical protein